MLLGFTGAGKSTLLNVVAGLIEYQGEVYFNQQNMNGIPTERRDVGYLLQDIYLFPHLNTFDNIAFGLRATSCPADKITEKGELADRIVVMINGELKQSGSVRDIFHQPAMEIQEFIAASN